LCTHAPGSHWELRHLDWFQFEKLVALLFDAEGFVVECYGGANADGGIDLLATKNGLTFGIQCKHWKATRAGIKEVRALFGALQDRNLQHGFLVTVQGYTHAASAYARRNGIELMDERTLLKNLEEVNWRMNPAFIELLDDERKVCPKCESAMVLRTVAKGAHVGRQFWGCSSYPRCRFTMAIG
jgi:restriction system protein